MLDEPLSPTELAQAVKDGAKNPASNSIEGAKAIQESTTTIIIGDTPSDSKGGAAALIQDLLEKEIDDQEVSGEASTESSSPSPSSKSNGDTSPAASSSSPSLKADQDKAKLEVQAAKKVDIEEEKIMVMKKPEVAPQPKIFTFSSSRLPLNPELSSYLQELMKDAYNKWCLDCKVAQSTHAIVYFGTFVCERCAQELTEIYGRAAIWPKKVLKEHWDDYQLMHVARGAGGNKPLFLLFQEYALESSDIREKYNSKVFAWYQRKLRALCDGQPFDEAKPSKTWSEAWDRTKEKAKDKLQRFNNKAVNLAHRADARLTRSRKVGRAWRKVRGVDQEGEGNAADQKDMKEPAAKDGDNLDDNEDEAEAAADIDDVDEGDEEDEEEEDQDSSGSNEGNSDVALVPGSASKEKKSSPAKGKDEVISAAEEGLKNAEHADMLHDQC